MIDDRSRKVKKKIIIYPVKMSLGLTPKDFGLSEEDKRFWEQELTDIHREDDHFWIRFTHFNQFGRPVFETYQYYEEDPNHTIRDMIKEKGHNHVFHNEVFDTTWTGFMNEENTSLVCHLNHDNFLRNYFQYLMNMTEMNRRLNIMNN